MNDRALPLPDEPSAQHSARVLEHLHSRIRAAGGSIGFAEFMHEVLYAPGLGYYSAGSRKFGAAGDFVTAPEISPLFGRIVAAQCAELLEQMPGASLLEPGAGTGKLAATVIARLAELDQLPEQYLILEVSPELVERQRTTLRKEVPRYCDRVRWVSEWPAHFRGTVVANEVVDALPVERFRKSGTAYHQMRVGLGQQGLEWREAPAGPVLQAALEALDAKLAEPLTDGYESEVSLSASAWVAELAAVIREGYVLLFDYGVSRSEYYAAERNGGWLRCHFRHHAHSDALRYPGIQDLTAWVDFSRIADAANAAGMRVDGFVTQSHFLMNGGLDAELAGLAEMPDRERLRCAQEVKILTLPGEMGENFKCLGFGTGGIEMPSAFSSANRAAVL